MSENKETAPAVIPDIHKNLPLRAINQVVFRGDSGFADATTVLLLNPEETRTYEFLFSQSEDEEKFKFYLERWIEKTLPLLPPEDFVLLAIHSGGAPLEEEARRQGATATHFIFVKEGAFEFRDLDPEDFRPRKLEIKVLENGLRFYADATYLIWNAENAVPDWVEETEAAIMTVQRLWQRIQAEAGKPFLTAEDVNRLDHFLAFIEGALATLEKRWSIENGYPDARRAASENNR